MYVSYILFIAIVFTYLLIFLGPDFWGLLNPEWNLCSKGHRQSPVDVDPAKLLYDPFLRVIHVDKHRVRYSIL